MSPALGILERWRDLDPRGQDPIERIKLQKHTAIETVVLGVYALPINKTVRRLRIVFRQRVSLFRKVYKFNS